MPRSMRFPLAATVIVALSPLAAGVASACTLAPVVAGRRTIADGSVLNAPLLDAAVLARVNLARCRAGRAALAPAPGLARVAQAQARWLAGEKRLTHDGGPPGLGTLAARLSASGLSYRSGGENIATAAAFRLAGIRAYRGSKPCQFRTASGRPIARQSYASLAEEVVTRWLASPGHRRNLLDAGFRYSATAAGFDRGGPFCGTFYLAQLFAG